MISINCKTNALILFCILLVRIIGALIIQTSFVPDEYWQSLEVAHKITFGYGYLTWEWKKNIRSCIYPLMFHLLFRFFPESLETIILFPKIFQAMLSSIGDFCVYKLSCKLFGWKCGRWTLFNLLTSWFLFYCSSRTLTNMAETSFTACGLYFYPWHRRKQERLTINYLWFSGASALMRPTAIVVWLPLYVYHVWRERNYSHVIKYTFLIGSTVLAVLMMCDRWFYGCWVLTPYNFFLFNWKNDIGAFYGQHNFVWYFSTGLPVVLGIHLIPFLMGVRLVLLRPFYLLILWIILVFSVLSHKEFRFLLPILPIALVICSAVMHEISSGRMITFGYKVNKKFNLLLVFAIFLINIPLSLYMSLLHQKGTIDATVHLSRLISKNSSVLFLMPCHSTPYYSYIHQNISMKFLSCEPNFNGTTDYTEEAEVFYQNPSSWLARRYGIHDAELIPSHILMFDTLYVHVEEFLKKYNYHLCYRTFHSHFFEKRTGAFVHIYCK